MTEKDATQRFIFRNTQVRGEIVRLTHSYQTIILQHDYPPAIKHLMGEALAAITLLSSTIKMPGRLTLQFQGKGSIKLVLAQCNHQSELRGVIQWNGSVTPDDITASLKNGTMAIIISPDATTQPYQGIVSFQEETLAQNIEIYFKNSEQLPTRLWLAVDEQSATGLLIQKMPESTTPLEVKEDWERINYLAETITAGELLTLDNKTILHRLFSQEDVEVFAEKPVKFKCTCSIQRCENSILMLGLEEVEEELKLKQKIVVTCEFCNKQYEFDRVAISNIFKNDGNSSHTLH